MRMRRRPSSLMPAITRLISETSSPCSRRTAKVTSSSKPAGARTWSGGAAIADRPVYVHVEGPATDQVQTAVHPDEHDLRRRGCVQDQGLVPLSQCAHPLAVQIARATDGLAIQPSDNHVCEADDRCIASSHRHWYRSSLQRRRLFARASMGALAPGREQAEARNVAQAGFRANG